MLQLTPLMYLLCTLVSVGLIPDGKLYGFLMLLNIAKLFFIKVVLIYIPASSVSLALSSPALYYVIFLNLPAGDFSAVQCGKSMLPVQWAWV